MTAPAILKPEYQATISLPAYFLTSLATGQAAASAITCAVDNLVTQVMLRILPEIQNSSDLAKLLTIPAKVGISYGIAVACGLPVSLLGTAGLYATSKIASYFITTISLTKTRNEGLDMIGEAVVSHGLSYLIVALFCPQNAISIAIPVTESIIFISRLIDPDAMISDPFVRHFI